MENILFDNYYDSDREDECRQYLFDEHNEDGEWESLDGIPDDEVWGELSFQEETNWGYFKNELEHFLEGSSWLIYGSCGLWTGRHAAGKVVNTLSEMSTAWNSCDYIKFTDDDGHLFLKCSHHDGTNCFEIKRITNKGLQFLEAHDWDDMPLKEMHEKIFNSNFYSALPRFAEKVYGCKPTRSHAKNVVIA